MFYYALLTLLNLLKSTTSKIIYIGHCFLVQAMIPEAFPFHQFNFSFSVLFMITIRWPIIL